MKSVEVDGVTWQVATEGEEGPALLLVHGFPLSHEMWIHQLEGLQEAARVIAPDLPGFGASSPPVGAAPTMESFADGLARLLDVLQVDQPVVFCGLSMGGYIGWQFWRRHRERLAAMICCDTRAAEDTPEVARGREMMAATVRANGAEGVAEGMIPKLFAKAAVNARTVAVKNTERVIQATLAKSIASGQLAMATRVDATEWLPEIALPTLLVVGDEDGITTPAEMRDMAAVMPNAEFIELAEAGHMAPLEQPDAFNERVREFLGKLS